jgi:hypothetical protein
MKNVNKVNMVDALSTQVRIRNIQTCCNNNKKNKVKRRIMEEVNQFPE